MSTLASPPVVVSPPKNSKPRLPLTKKNVGWGILFLMALAVLVIIDIPFLSASHVYRPYHLKVRSVLLPHLVFGTFAILAGPVQFSTRVRRKYPRFHRILGRLYVGSILIAAPMGALIPIVGPKDSFFTAGVIVHAVTWFITTLMAFLTARNRHIVQHKQWMVRSYVLTFSFVITRVLGPVWGAMHITITQYGMVDVMLNLAYIMGTDIALNWREITTRRA